MDAELYREMMVNDLKADTSFETVNIPVDALPGESDEDAAERWLYEQGILFTDESGAVFVDAEKATAFDPNLLKILKAVFEPEVLSVLDSLVENGLVWAGVDEDGEAVYGLTDAGEEYVNRELGQI